MKKLCLFFILISIHVQAQTSQSWMFSSAGASGAAITEQLKFSNGDLLVFGFNSGGDIDPGPGVYIPSQFHFIARYTPSGTMIFARPLFYNAATTNTQGGLKIDAYDNFYLSITGPGSYQMNSGGGITFSLSSQHAILKFDAMGNYKWNLAFPGEVFPPGYAVQSDGSMIVTGSVSGSAVPVDLDPGPGTYLFTLQNIWEGFLAKFDSSGNFITAKEFHVSTTGPIDNCDLDWIAIDQNDNLVIMGTFEGTVDFDPGAGTFLQTGTSIGGVYFTSFVLKLDANLNYVFAFQIPDALIAGNIQVDENNNIYFSGTSETSGDIDPSAGTTIINPQNVGCSFIAKFSPSGGFEWAKTLYSSWLNYNGLYISGFENNGNINCLVTADDTIFANNLGIPLITSQGDYPSTYMVRLDSLGNYIYSFDLASDTNMAGQKITFTDNSHFYFSGRVQHHSDVLIGPGINVLNTVINNPITTEFFISFYSLDAQINQLSGNVFIDINGNNIHDVNENGIQNSIVEVSNGLRYASTNNSGNYTAYVPSGNYTIKTAIPFTGLSGPVPSVNLASFTGTNQVDSANNFAFAVLPNEPDIAVTLTAYGIARPGGNMNYTVTYTNYGSTIQSGVVEVNLDPLLTFVSSSIPPSGNNGNLYQWNYSNLNPFQTSGFNLIVNVSTSAQLGDSVYSQANITPIAGDIVPQNNYDTSVVAVRASADPNFKEVNPAGNITTLDITAGHYLTYTLQFQNTGNDTAFNVTLLDTLSGLFDLSSFRVLSSSHPYKFTLYNGNLAEFKFRNILLPDSTVDEPASHGFVKYQVKPLSTLTAGTLLENKCYIYFDYNQPVLTNTTTTLVVNQTSVNEMESNDIILSPNPFTNYCLVSYKENTISSFDITDVTGKVILKQAAEFKSGSTIINFENVQPGLYLLRVYDSNKNSIIKKKLIKL